MMTGRSEQSQRGLVLGRAVVAPGAPALTGLEARLLALEMAHAGLAGEMRQLLRQQSERARALEAAVVRLEELLRSLRTERGIACEDDAGAGLPKDPER